MFYYLPLEVNLHLIKFLSNSELLKCSEACRDWNTFIKSNVNIQMLELTTPKAFNSAMIAAKKQYINGDQVASLITSCDSEQCCYAIETIPRVFPNVKTFKVGSFSFFDTDGFLQLRKIMAYKKWESCLETLQITGSVLELRMLLETCQFERLTDLCVTFNHVEFKEERNNKFMASLQHFPTLQTLIINGGTFTLEILQNIHTWLPSLNALSIGSTEIFIPPGALLNDAGSASTLTSLSLTLGWHINEWILYNPILQYITSSYPSLTHLTLQIGNHSAEPRLQRGAVFSDRANVISDMISQLPLTLESLRNMLNYTKNIHVDVLDNAVTTGKLPNLTEMSIWIPPIPSDNYITLPYLYSKKMFNNITSLHVKTSHFYQLFPPNPFPSNLNKLYIIKDGLALDSLALDSILEAHASLKELTLDEMTLNLTVNENYRNREYFIEKLSLRTPSLTYQVITFIRETMPYLKNLTIPSDHRFMKIVASIQDTNVMEPLSLPNHNLEKLRLHSNQNHIHVNRIVVHIQTAIGHRYYFYDCKNHKMTHRGTEFVGFETDENGLCYYLKVECKHLQHLVVNQVVFF